MRWCTAFVALGWVGLASGQAQEPLRLGTVYDSLDAHPMIEAARAGVRAGEARIGPAGRWPDPRVQFGLMGRELPGLGLQSPLGMTTLQVTQMIPLAGQPGLAARAAEARAAAARERVTEARWEVRSRAAMLFYDLYLAKEGLELAAASKRVLEQVAATATGLYAAGEGRQSDVLRAQVEVARMNEDIVRMQALSQSMAIQLNAMLRRPLNTAIGAVARPVLPDTLPPIDSLERGTLADRALLRAGRRELEASEAGVARARRDIWPDLEVGLQYGQRPMEDGGTDRMISLMFGASVPIHAGSRQKQMRLEALAMRDETAAELTELEAETRGRLGVLYAEFQRAAALSALYQASVIPQAEANAAAALSAYGQGSSALAELLEAQLAVIRYRSALVQWQAEQGKAVAELERLVAARLIDPNSAVPRTGRPQ